MQQIQPLAERIRPKKLSDFINQKHLLGDDGTIKKMLDNQMIASMLLWGPPGTGKTTLAQLIAKYIDRPFFSLSAINSGVKEIREVIDFVKNKNLFTGKNPILFIDEIHRFSKSQQDSLLEVVEKGWVVLIGATTENPSFEVIPALLSRCQTYVLNHLDKDDLEELLQKAIVTDELLKSKNIVLKETNALIRFSGGDARKLLNGLELVVNNFGLADELVITNKNVTECLQQNATLYDKQGEQHYDIVSAFIKSIRGSDPNGAVYWLARMIDGGEDVKFIARRMLISASEDIGNANPTALVMATTTFTAVEMIGYPEARIILSQCAVYLATSAKSNSTYLAINDGINLVKETGNLPIPLHLRNAPTKLMKSLDYGKGYKYAHSYENNFVLEQFLPTQLVGKILYNPGNNQRENATRVFLKERWGKSYDY